MFSKRRSIINYIIENLKGINGGVSPYSPLYTYQTNMGDRVARGADNFENMNDFPTARVIAGPERYIYQTIGCTESTLSVMVRCYLRHGERSVLKTQTDDFIQDVDHVIYNMPTNEFNIQTAHVVSIDTDQGLLDEYAVVEIELAIKYELDVI